jgi:hypothetical protein
VTRISKLNLDWIQSLAAADEPRMFTAGIVNLEIAFVRSEPYD